MQKMNMTGFKQFNAMQNKGGGEGDGEEGQHGAQDEMPAPAVEDVQSGGGVFMVSFGHMRPHLQAKVRTMPT